MDIAQRVDARRIFDSVAEIWILVDCHARVLLLSKHFQKFQLRYSTDVKEGSCLIGALPGRWQAMARDVLASLGHAEEPSVLEASFSDDNDNETFFEITCTGIRGENGGLIQVFIEARDVTTQKVFERKITMVARDYQSVIENANAVIIGTDARGYVTEWNDMASQVTGYTRKETYIRKFSDFLMMDSLDPFLSAVTRVLSDRVVTNQELIVRASDGRALTLLINATPRKSASGDVAGILLIGQDITELSAYRQSLEEKVRERTQALKSALENEKQLVEVKDRFVSMASHEFRSPISYIHRNIGALADHVGTLSTDDLKARLKKIQSQAEHLCSLLEDVLTMGRTGAAIARIKANLAIVDLCDFFHRIIDEVQSNTQHSHRIELAAPPGALTISSDEKLLRNIFVNLLTNAIKFSPGRDKVLMCVERSEHHVYCTVQDYGLGIEEVDLPKIFEPFHRGENARKISGTGLGLPIVKKAAETLGAELSVRSKPDEGTLFTVKFKL